MPPPRPRRRRACSSSRTSRHELEEARLLSRRRGARVREVDRHDARDAPRPRRHHRHACGEKHGFRDRVRDEDHRGSAFAPDLEQLHVQALARHLVERAEGLVHQEQSGRERERTCDRDALLHASRQLPRMVVAEVLELNQLEHLLDALRAAGAVPAEHLERQRDVLRHRAPVVEDRRLEDDAVVAVEPRAARGLPVDRHGRRSTAR